MRRRVTGEENEWKNTGKRGGADEGGAAQVWREAQAGEEHKETGR